MDVNMYKGQLAFISPLAIILLSAVGYKVPIHIFILKKSEQKKKNQSSCYMIAKMQGRSNKCSTDKHE